MLKKVLSVFTIAAIIATMVGCSSNNNKNSVAVKDSTLIPGDTTIAKKIKNFALVKLTTDLSKLTEKEKQMLPILIEISKIMDDIFWQQTFADRKAFLDTCKDEAVKKFFEINYGPWERMNLEEENKPFIPVFGKKTAGINFYPADITKDEFEKLNDKNKTSPYTILVRNSDKSLKVVWYHEAYKENIEKAAELLKKAAELAEDPGLKKYLELRSKALLTDDYFESDMAWMDMKNNTIDFVVGPIENYDDELFGYKTSYEAAVLVKDKEWSQKLAKYTSMLPMLQKELPVDAKYKKEKPGANSDLNAYDIVYYAGDANKGGKTIAINLPNDENVQLKKGSRRLQLKNAMKAKFDNILVPISGVLTDSAERKNISFNAFFANVMFHEVAHGLGIKNTVNGKGMVRDALKELYSSFEEAKADILGLFMVTKLIEKGELKDVTVEESYATFMAGIIRSVRFGAADSHGKANMMCFNFFEDAGAFTRNANGTYKVDFEKTKAAMNKWAEKVLLFEGNGDYEGAMKYLKENGTIRPTLKSDIDRLQTAKIPVDIIFDQGIEALGLK